MFCTCINKDKKMIIENIDTSKKVMIVAEIGNNHEGSFDLAKKLVFKAAEVGVDAVKFQTFIPEHISGGDKSRLERLRGFQLSHDQFLKLAQITKDLGLIFFSTPFDIESANFLNKIQPVFKIASGDNNFYPLIETILSYKKPTIISTGVADLFLVEELYNKILETCGIEFIETKLALLHCVSSYPVPDENANLGAITHLKKLFPRTTIGYSDHTMGINAPILSVMAGSRIIEKHFTINKNHSNFRDHQLSADPEDMYNLVAGVRQAEKFIGQQEIKLEPVEIEMNILVRRSIAAARDLAIGTKLKMSDIIWVRPGNGIPPGKENLILGKLTTQRLSRGQIIKLSDLK